MRRFRVQVVTMLWMVFAGSSCSDDNTAIQPVPLPGEDIHVEDPAFKVVGYFPSWRFSLIDQLEFEKLTHVNIAFGNLNSGGDLEVQAGTARVVKQ